jgi:hypothetical protein
MNKGGGFMKNTAELTMASPEYRKFIEDLKTRVISARIEAARAVNRDLILLYWDIGRGIVEKQQILGWGESVVDRISTDLKEAFPATTGFSPRNLRDMKCFYLAYSDLTVWRKTITTWSSILKTSDDPIWPQLVAKLEESDAVQILPQLVAEIPWGHHRFILDKVSDHAARIYYIHATRQFGWSRNVLLNQIKAGAYERAVIEKKTHNFQIHCRNIWLNRRARCSRALTISNSSVFDGRSRNGTSKTG